MKNAFYYSTMTWAFILVVILSGCQKEDNFSGGISNNSKTLRSGASDSLMEVIGDYHNLALEELMQKEYQGSMSEIIQSVVFDIDASLNQFGIYRSSEEFVIFEEHLNQLVTLRSQSDSALVNYVYSYVEDSLSANGLNLISMNELNYMQRFKEVFQTDFSLMSNYEKYTYINSELSEILSDCNEEEWDYYSDDGNLIRGAIAIGLSSNEFWYANGGEIDPIASAYLIQGDCLGYIIGWGRAVINDYRSNNLHPSGQGRRIEDGIYVGVSFSLGIWRGWGA